MCLVKKLHGSVPERFEALAALKHSNLDIQAEVFQTVVELCTAVKFAKIARQVILSMRREWVLSHIEDAVNHVLAKGDNIDYSMILVLLGELDHRLARKIAKTAILHPDFDIREVGLDFLSH